jgi:hypothetical protein
VTNVRARNAGRVLSTLVMVAGLISTQTFAASHTFTGTIGDAMCGLQHVMPGDAVSCTKGCTSKGSKYALLVGNEVYVLETTDKAPLATFETRAGEKVVITGTQTGNTIKVSSVKTAR